MVEERTLIIAISDPNLLLLPCAYLLLQMFAKMHQNAFESTRNLRLSADEYLHTAPNNYRLSVNSYSKSTYYYIIISDDPN